MFYSAAGALLLVIYNFLFFTGLRVGLAGAGGVLVTTTNPLFTFLILSVFLKTKLKINEFIGIFLGLLGGLTIIGVWNADPQIIFQKGNILFLIASFVWALLTITSRKGISIGTPYMTYSFYLYLFCTLFSFPFALKHNILKPLDAGISFWMNIIFLSTIVTAFATTTYFYASNRLGSGKASSFIFLVPLSAMLLSWLILNEQPAISTIIGGVMALSAVYMINIKTSKLNK